MAAVRWLADLDVERDLTEKLDAELGRLLARAAIAEDVALMAAFRTLEVTHVLDDAEHRHVDLAQHVEPLVGIEKGDVLRRRDDDRAEIGRASCRERVCHYV